MKDENFSLAAAVFGAFVSWGWVALPVAVIGIALERAFAHDLVLWTMIGSYVAFLVLWSRGDQSPNPWPLIGVFWLTGALTLIPVSILN